MTPHDSEIDQTLLGIERASAKCPMWDFCGVRELDQRAEIETLQSKLISRGIEAENWKVRFWVIFGVAGLLLAALWKAAGK